MTEINTNSGVILESLNNKLDRDLQNLDYDVDFVIRWKAPTTNDPTWYRIYKSGWCEQGGIVGEEITSGYPTITVSLLKEFINTNFNVQITGRYTQSTSEGTAYCNNRTTNTITIVSVGYGCDWEAKGLIDINNI